MLFLLHLKHFMKRTTFPICLRQCTPTFQSEHFPCTSTQPALLWGCVTYHLLTQVKRKKGGGGRGTDQFLADMTGLPLLCSLTNISLASIHWSATSVNWKPLSPVNSQTCPEECWASQTGRAPPCSDCSLLPLQIRFHWWLWRQRWRGPWRCWPWVLQMWWGSWQSLRRRWRGPMGAGANCGAALHQTCPHQRGSHTGHTCKYKASLVS